MGGRHHLDRLTAGRIAHMEIRDGTRWVGNCTAMLALAVDWSTISSLATGAGTN